MSARHVVADLVALNASAEKLSRELDAPITSPPTLESVLFQEVALLRESQALYKGTLDCLARLLKLHEIRAAKYRDALQEIAALDARATNAVAECAVLIAQEALE